MYHRDLESYGTLYSKTQPAGVAVTDLRVRRNRAALRQALLDLLQTQPFDRITIRDITERAGVGYTTYFRHYANKESLLDDLAAEEIAGLVAMTLPVYDAADSLAACVALCRFVDAHRALWSALLTGGAESFVRGELLRQGRVASAGRAPRGWLPPELGLNLAVSAIVELLAWWLRQSAPMPAERVAEIMDRIAISPAAHGEN